MLPYGKASAFGGLTYTQQDRQRLWTRILRRFHEGAGGRSRLAEATEKMPSAEGVLSAKQDYVHSPIHGAFHSVYASVSDLASV